MKNDKIWNVIFNYLSNGDRPTISKWVLEHYEGVSMDELSEYFYIVPDKKNTDFIRIMGFRKAI